MRVCNLSVDQHILNSESVAASRAMMYGTVTEQYTICIPAADSKAVQLSSNVQAYAVAGATKITQLINLYKQVSSLVKKDHYDVICGDQYYLGLLAYYIAKKHHIGFQSQVLGFEKVTFLRRRIAKFLFNRASSIRVNSPRLIKVLARDYDTVGEKIQLAPIYVNLEKMKIKESSQVANVILDRKNFHFLSVNRLVSVKNIQLQIRAIASLHKAYSNVRLHILGSGPEQASLQAFIAELGMSDIVQLHGHVTGAELGAYYTEADCFLLTSHSEGWGMVIIEALSAGLPVIMTDVGCAGEVIIHEESGIVIPVNDDNALISAMKKIISDSSYREQIISGGEMTLQKLLPLAEILELYRQSWEFAAKHKL